MAKTEKVQPTTKIGEKGTTEKKSEKVQPKKKSEKGTTKKASIDGFYLTNFSLCWLLRVPTSTSG